MAANDTKRFYWFKCDHEFFNGTKMVRLRKSKAFSLDTLSDEDKRQICSLAMQAVYIKLLAESCTHNGELLYDDGVPYDDEGISEIVECPENFMRFTKDRLKKLNLLTEDEDGKLTLMEMSDYIGSETGAASRKRGQRGDSEGSRRGHILDNGGTMSPNVPQMSPSKGTIGDNGGTIGENVSKRIEIRDKSIKKEEVGIKGGAGENPPPPVDEDCQLKYPKERLMRMCRGQAFALVLMPDEVEPFVDYLLDKGCCEKEANQTVTPSYVKAIAMTWKRDGFADKDRHRVTRQELAEVVHRLNKDRTTPIADDTVNRFWDFLVGNNFSHRDGDMVTKHTVARMLTKWIDVDTSKSQPEEEKKQKTASEEYAEISRTAKRFEEGRKAELMELEWMMQEYQKEQETKKGAGAR